MIYMPFKDKQKGKDRSSDLCLHHVSFSLKNIT